MRVLLGPAGLREISRVGGRRRTERVTVEIENKSPQAFGAAVNPDHTGHVLSQKPSPLQREGEGLRCTISEIGSSSHREPAHDIGDGVSRLTLSLPFPGAEEGKCRQIL